MKFVFWQNMVSIHQSALLKCLFEDYSILLVVAQDFEKAREESGWNTADMGNISIISAPSRRMISSLLKEHSEAVHIFSGITAFPIVYDALKRACEMHLTTFVYMEPYETAGIKGILRLIHYRLLAWRFNSSLNGILATGETGVNAYIKAGFTPNKIYEWGYFTEEPESTKPQLHRRNKRQVLFVGRLDNNKQVIPLIKIFCESSSKTADLTIVGSGPLKHQIEEIPQQNPTIQYLGIIPNKELKQLMHQFDLLILPSKYDGWGCVVNEAMQAGMQVLCSDACGASTLIRHTFQGDVFSWNKPMDFETKLQKQTKLPPLSTPQREQITNWARIHISAQEAKKYLLDIIAHATTPITTKPLPPWKQHK